MKRWLFLLVMFCVAGAVQAQTTVSGRVIDQSNSQPMPFATVAVLIQDSTVLTGAVTDNKGEYAIGVKNQGEYILAVSFINFAGITTLILILLSTSMLYTAIL